MNYLYCLILNSTKKSEFLFIERFFFLKNEHFFIQSNSKHNYVKKFVGHIKKYKNSICFFFILIECEMMVKFSSNSLLIQNNHINF